MTDVRAYVDTLLWEAVKTYYADPRAALMPFYLYYQPGKLLFVPDLPAPSWTLADPFAHRGFLQPYQLCNLLGPLVSRLPLLPAEPPSR